MKYDVIIINSDNAYDYFKDSAEGINFINVDAEELEEIMKLSFRQNFTLILQKHEEE